MTCLKMGLWLSDQLLLARYVGLTAGVAGAMVLAAPSYAACDFFSMPQRYNTQLSEDVIVIGSQSRRPYQVVVPSQDLSMLADIRACVLDAFATRSSSGGALPSRFGFYIQVGSFSRRRDAEVVGRVLTRSGYPARVTYSH